ncbi:PREDICTED: E3 ubiquitin-protein ligase rififylin isoform X1 [Thamnophis sirtalis]|uniref:RING-type E3 ubiquitin transferase n=2 Tax=Thamnophis sirtalis TaxID=35019 RepID=A0A6I9XP80_9SAUR|nr:PREDICTED: E3 ubiquitin-protein ligase rififylin isoform X1 [Thamnophis sirtalis]
MPWLSRFLLSKVFFKPRKPASFLLLTDFLFEKFTAIMWAACCNWFCLNGQPEDMPHCPQPGTRAYSNAGYSSFPSPTASEQSCKACGVHFSSSFLKRVCLDCKKSFCPSCSHQPESSPCLCHLCERFRATAFQREELIKMKVKDLRDYLELREISTEMCREKDELVCLIISQQPLDPQRERAPQVPCPAPVSVAQEECTVTPVSQDYSPEQISTNPALQTEEHPQANGHVLPSQDDMAEVESAVQNLPEEETQSTDSEDNLVTGRRASLSDLTSLRDIDALSVRQLKEILARNFVNYKGCCEKWELMERVTRLYKEKDLQQLVSDTDDQTGKHLLLCLLNIVSCNYLNRNTYCLPGKLVVLNQCNLVSLFEPIKCMYALVFGLLKHTHTHTHTHTHSHM